MEEIKASDLMLNNWVEYDGKYYQISALSEEYPFLNTDAFGVGVVTYRNIKGIPLTENILLKAGFERKRFIFLPNYLRDCFSSCSFYISIVEDKLFYDWLGANAEIKYLHQLQNLFKSLTGNDLKIEV